MASHEPFAEGSNRPFRESDEAIIEPPPAAVANTPWWAVPASEPPSGQAAEQTNSSSNQQNVEMADVVPAATAPDATQNSNAPNNAEGGTGTAQVYIIPENLSVIGAMENLPHIRPQELKIIGRCVCFVADCIERGEPRDYYFQGMVSQITKDTVTMLEVLKFTVDGFFEYRNKNAMMGSLSGSEGNQAGQIAAIGAALPRRRRNGTSRGPSAPQSAYQSASAMPTQQAVVSPTAFSLSPGPGVPLPPPAIISTNNYSHGVISEASATEPALYDYASYNRTNYYDNSSTMMPGVRPPVLTAPNSSPNVLATGRLPFRHPLLATPSAGEALFTVIPNRTEGGGGEGWSRDQPLAHYKFMTFARRKIRKVEFSTDHPMAGLLQPYYVSYYYRPHWEPHTPPLNSTAATAAAAPDGEQSPDSHNSQNNTNNPAAASNLTPVQPTPVENTRKAKERAKLRWKEQQAEDRPIPLRLPIRHQNLVGIERDTSHPFMGINLKCVDPIGYRQRRHAYKEALKNFFESNAEARALAPNALRPAYFPSLSPLGGGRYAYGEQEPTTVTTTTAAAVSPYPDELESAVDSDASDEEEEAALASSSAGRAGGASRLMSSGSQHGPLSPPTVPLAPKHRREASAIGHGHAYHTAAPEDTEMALKIPQTVVSMRDIDPATLSLLAALGAPTKPPLYESPQTVESIYNDPKWRANPYLLQDLERVRMFLRRFLVHTSQGNNQKRIPLLTFIAQRCPWPNPSESLLKELLYEDLHTLLRVESELVAKSQGNDGRNRNNGNGDANPAFIGALGEEINPGRVLLASTGITARTTYISIAHIALSIGLLLYAASAFSSLEKFFVSQYANNTAAWVVAAAACHLFLGAATGFHSMKMQVPLVLSHAAPRLIMQAVSLTLMILCFCQVLILMVSETNTLRGISQRASWLEMAAEGNEDLCNFMVRYTCSGYDRPCDTDADQCVSSCLSTVLLYSARCQKAVNDAVSDSLLPILVLISLCLVAIIADLLYMWRYISVARRLQRAL